MTSELTKFLVALSQLGLTIRSNKEIYNLYQRLYYQERHYRYCPHKPSVKGW